MRYIIIIVTLLGSIFIISVVGLVWIFLNRHIRSKYFDPHGRVDPIEYKDISISYHDEGYSYVRSHSRICHDITIIIIRGRYGNYTDYIKLIESFSEIDVNFVYMDYPGFGLDYGKRTPTLKLCMDSVIKEYEYARNTWNKPIIVLGHSLGSYFAIQLSLYIDKNYNDNYKIILLSPFSSIGDMIVPDRFSAEFISSMFKSIDNNINIRNLRCDILILHSKDDDVIPYRCAETLHSHAGRSYLHCIGGTHTRPIFDIETVDKLFDFINLSVCDEDKMKFVRSINQ